MSPELDERRIIEFERKLLASGTTRVGAQELWRHLARVFPHRTPGPSERRLLLDALTSVEERGHIRLPPVHGIRWDRSIEPAVPTSVDIVRESTSQRAFPWRTFPWHARLHWVPACRKLSAQQVEFLRRVHEGFVTGSFRERAPLKYRSLQLTGDEKMLGALTKTGLFGPERLTLELLGCLPDALPLAWEAVGSGGRMLIFENAGPFNVARRVLAAMQARPYDLVAYGGGRAILASLGHLGTIDRKIESIHYVGDLDQAGLEIAWSAQRASKALGLPDVLPATELHRCMLSAAEAFGHPTGWPARQRLVDVDRSTILGALAAELRGRVDAILGMGCRVPEEILGPEELRVAWS